MAKRKDSFSRALADAMKRLEQAERQRQSTREILARLELEIPALQRTIIALDRQLNPGCSSPVELAPQPLSTRESRGRVDGSIPSPGANEPTEEDLLPEPEGTPVVPEE